MEPPAPEQLYQINELKNGFTQFLEVLEKIKTDLKLNSFLELANYLAKVYEHIVAQIDIGKKNSCFHVLNVRTECAKNRTDAKKSGKFNL